MPKDYNKKSSISSIIYFVITIILIPIIVAFVIWFPYKIIPIGDENGWLGFFGGYLGSLLGVFAAYKIAQIEIKKLEEQFNNEQKIKYENWLIEQYPSIYKMNLDIKMIKIIAKKMNCIIKNSQDINIDKIKALLSDISMELWDTIEDIKVPKLSEKLINLAKSRDALLEDLKQILPNKEQLDIYLTKIELDYNKYSKMKKDKTIFEGDLIKKRLDPKYKTIEEKQKELLDTKNKLLDANKELINKLKNFVPHIENIIDLCNDYLVTSNNELRYIEEIININKKSSCNERN